jgi:hypothetical protein
MWRGLLWSQGRTVRSPDPHRAAGACEHKSHPVAHFPVVAPRYDTVSMRAARNAYAAILLLGVTAAYASLWILPELGIGMDVGLEALAAAGLGAVAATTQLAAPLRHAATFIHELAHCVAAVAVGASPRKITYQPNASGLAVLAFPSRVGRWRKSIVLLAGYLGPGVAAGAVTAGLRAGRPQETLIVFALCAAGALVLLVRNAWGALVTTLLGVLCWATARVVPENFAVAILAFVVGALPVLGVRDTLEQYRLRNPGECDAAAIATELPFLSWRIVARGQIAATASLTVGVAWLLLGSPGL